jgi:hypothetical protein
MGKKLALLVAGLACCSSLSAEAAGTGPRGDEVGGCVVRHTDVKGQLVKQRVVLGGPLQAPGQAGADALKSPCVVFLWKLKAADKAYDLDLGESQALLRQAEALQGRAVVVTGWVRGGRIEVVGLKADDVRLTGKLVREVEGHRPLVRWYLEAGCERDGATAELSRWELNFPTPELLRQANALAGQDVRVTGTFEDGRLTVTDLTWRLFVRPRKDVARSRAAG